MKKKWLFLCIAATLVLVFAGCSAEQTEAPVSQTETAGQSTETGELKDGTYSGVARGYKKGLHVDVTIQGGKIVDVQIAKNNEDEPYLTDSLVVIPQIIESQSTEVDAVAGATKTCIGIGKAVKNALEQAQ